MPNNSNQFQLLTQKRFLPYFITQFLGAFNDNVYKTSLLVLIALAYAKTEPQTVNLLNNLGTALFICPFFLFSAFAGQLADHYPKYILIRWVKLLEIIITLLVAVGFYIGHFPFLLAVLFLLGAQSAFFSPVKYSLLPQYLEKRELLGGNGLVEMGTFVAILVGTIIGGVLAGFSEMGLILLSTTLITCAVIGFFTSILIPPPPQMTPTKTSAFRPFKGIPFHHTFQIVKELYALKELFWVIIGISWFWLFGAVLLTQLPNFAQLFLGGTTEVITLLLVLTSLGIGIGSLMCEQICKHPRSPDEYLKLIPFGALGVTVFMADLSFNTQTALPPVKDFMAFLSNPHHYRAPLDLFFMGIFAGFYSVPLYVRMQTQSPEAIRSQMIASNNVFNAISMTLGSFLAIFVLRIGLSIPQLFLVLALMNVTVMLVLFIKIPLTYQTLRDWVLRKNTP